MSEKQLWLDGNALAGTLGEIFGAEMTETGRGCQHCGRHHPVGAHRAYYGAGAVLRCPSCGAIAMRIAALPDRWVVSMVGAWTMEVPRG
jgi:hypothetical protein